LLHVIAAKAACLKQASTAGLKSHIEKVIENARVLATRIAERGFRIVSGGTDTQLMLVDGFSTASAGPRAEAALDTAGITVNKNTIPYDANPPMRPSGIRIGSPALTSRGMGAPEMETIGNWIADVIENIDDPGLIRRIRGEVSDLCRQFP